MCMMRTTQAVADVLAQKSVIVDVLSGEDADALATRTDWVEASDGGPESYELIAVFDESVAGTTERDTANAVTHHAYTAVDQLDIPVELEPLGHGTVVDGEYTDHPVLAVHVV